MNKKHKIFISIATVLSLIAGVLHATIIAFEHTAPLPLETLFFLVGGIAQIVLAILVIKTDRLKYILPLFIINGGLAFVWLLTRLFRAPFMNSPEEVGTLGLVVFAFEIAALILLSTWKWKRRNIIRELHGYTVLHVIVGVVALSLISGASVYIGGMIGEIIMPERTLVHGHGHTDTKPHAQMEDGHVDKVPHAQEDDGHIDEVPHNQEKDGSSDTAPHVDIVPHDDTADHIDEVPHD